MPDTVSVALTQWSLVEVFAAYSHSPPGSMTWVTRPVSAEHGPAAGRNLRVTGWLQPWECEVDENVQISGGRTQRRRPA